MPTRTLIDARNAAVPTHPIEEAIWLLLGLCALTGLGLSLWI